MSHRVPQIESALKRAITEVLQRDMADPRIQGLVSITKVQVSPDLRDAFVHVSVLPEQYANRTLYGLKHAATHIHGVLKKKLPWRSVPHLDFRMDDSLKKQAQVQQAIKQGIADTAQRPAPQDANPSSPAAQVDEDSD